MSDSEWSPWPCYSDQEVEAAVAVLKSGKVNYWTGSQCVEFEKEFAEWVDCRHAVAVANGTVALELALRAIGVSAGDKVVVTSRTFLASASSIINVGGVPVFADVDPVTQNITAETIEAVWSDGVKAIVCVHLAGWPCDMDPILDLARRKNMFVIEDCAQAHGARYKGRPVGSIGDVGCWSFCQDKIMTTGGEGGMVTTNKHELWSRMWAFKDHGKSWEAVFEREHAPGFRWLHESFGTNWRMTEVQAAIGRIQLHKMSEWHQKRTENANQIWAAASDLSGLRVPRFTCEGCASSSELANECVHAAYKCYVFVEGTERDRDIILEKINAAGVPCFSGSCSEIYLEKAFDGTGWRPEESLAIAKYLGQTSLMFLCHPTLTEAEITKTCEVLKQVVTDHFA